jgi:hypothetical protein
MKVRVLRVEETSTVKQFVTAHGIPYKKGCIYYQLTKKELIQDTKSLLVRRKSDNQIMAGTVLRSVLGIPEETTTFALNLSEVADFDVFVQSTSPVRKVLAGTTVLYESEEGQEVLEASVPVSDPENSLDVPSDIPSEVGPVEVVISFDTTGSMYPCLTQVRTHIRSLIRDLFTTIPTIRMGLIAHGDYGDVYVTKHTGLSTNQDTLCQFVETVSGTNGFDGEECYELVLREVHQKVNWTEGAKKVFVMIGDYLPHAVQSHRNVGRIDWRKEAKELVKRGITIYSVQALGNRHAGDAFWKPLARETGGIHLELQQFHNAKEYIRAICYHTQGQTVLQGYRDQLQGEGRMNRALHGMFATLLRDTTAFGGEEEGLEPVAPSRFQVLEVGERTSIKEFAQTNGLTFRVGRGFYEFTKPEVISDKKEVVLMNKRTGDMFTGEQAGRLIGAGGTGRIRPTDLEKWRVFVQSTSANRVLLANTGFLYEVEEA